MSPEIFNVQTPNEFRKVPKENEPKPKYLIDTLINLVALRDSKSFNI